jgi:molybdenum cofactor cytidylyltransferase
MIRSPNFAGVLLAAGESSRMGHDKALLPWPPKTAGTLSNETFLSVSIASLLRATEFVIVVVGKNEAVLGPIIYSQGASLVVNPDPTRGQFSSLQVGLQEVLNHGRDAAMATLVDRPPASDKTIRALHLSFQTADENVWAVVPEYSGKHGHPYIVGREMIELFLRAPANTTARDIENQNRAHVRYLPVDDPMVIANINTPQDYAALVERTIPQ